MIKSRVIFFITKGTEKEKKQFLPVIGSLWCTDNMAVFGECSRKKTLRPYNVTSLPLPTPLPIKFHKTEKFAHWSCVVLGWGGVAFIRLRSPKSFFGTLLMRNTGAVRCRGAHSEDKNWRVALVKLHYNANKMRTAIIPRRSIMFNRNMLYSVYIYIYFI